MSETDKLREKIRFQEELLQTGAEQREELSQVHADHRAKLLALLKERDDVIAFMEQNAEKDQEIREKDQEIIALMEQSSNKDQEIIGLLEQENRLLRTLLKQHGIETPPDFNGAVH